MTDVAVTDLILLSRSKRAPAEYILTGWELVLVFFISALCFQPELEASCFQSTHLCVKCSGRGAEFARNWICKERGWKSQGKENSRKGFKIRIHVNLQGMEFARKTTIGICKEQNLQEMAKINHPFLFLYCLFVHLTCTAAAWCHNGSDVIASPADCSVLSVTSPVTTLAARALHCLYITAINGRKKRILVN